MKYFSGTGTYRKTVAVSATLLQPNRRLYLDLGQVRVMARVRLNGQDLGLLWKAPYRIEVTEALKAGDNQLEVSVINLWINRMIGDEELARNTGMLRNMVTQEQQEIPLGDEAIRILMEVSARKS